MMRRWTLSLVAALIGAFGMVTAAIATTYTTLVSLNTSTYTDLGVGPLVIEPTINNILVVAADSLPSPSAPGHRVNLNTRFSFETTQHIYALAVGNATDVRITPIVAGGGGGGGAGSLPANSVAAGAYVAGSLVDGSDLTQGAKADTACGTDAGTGCTLLQRLARIATNLTTLNATASGPANLAAAATGGCTPGHAQTAASTNSTNIKNAAGTLCELTWLNTTTNAMFIRLYDAAAAPTCSSATGAVATYPVASNATSPGATIALGPFGKAFTNGIGFCVTGGGADTDNTNANTGVYMNWSFK